jgi:hypothetical protein
MRSSLVVMSLSVLALLPAAAVAQDGQGVGQGIDAKAAVAMTQQNKSEAAAPASALRARTNVKVELTISDQTGNGPVEKKTVSLIAAEESWGKIRTQATARVPEGAGAMPVGLNVDARPFLTRTGSIQLELTVAYNPLDATSAAKAAGYVNPAELKQLRPTELNQSMTVVLQSGKPMVISQAADPISDRKMIVEVVATILK